MVNHLAHQHKAQQFRDRYHAGNPGRQQIMLAIREEHDPGDAWGSTLGWMFGIADVLWHTTNSNWHIPDEWEYRHSIVCSGVSVDDYPDCEIAAMYMATHVSVEDLVYAGNVLNRYADWLQAAGKDY